MPDDFGTLRTKYYTRKVPYAGPNLTREQMEKLRANTDDKSKSTAQMVEEVADIPGLGLLVQPALNMQNRREAKERLLDQNPWLWQVLEGIVNARLNMFTSDEPWTKDKHYGWKMDITDKAMPESPYFEYAMDPNTGEIYVDDTDQALDLINKQPDWYESERKKFEDYLTHPYNFSMTPALRDKEGNDAWYQTTDDFLNALLATKFNESDRQALYDAAQYVWHNRINQEMQKFIKDNPSPAVKEGDRNGAIMDDDAEYFRSPYSKFLKLGNDNKPMRDPQGNFYVNNMFVPKSIIRNALGDMFIPSMNAVLSDPELYYRTDSGELIKRGISDASLLALGALLPGGMAWLGAKKLGRPVLGAMAGGALGGGLEYGAQRINNEMFDRFTGHGTDNQPLNAVDLGASMITGGLTGPLLAPGAVKGMRETRRAMNPLNPSSVTNSDIKASFNAAKLYGGDKPKQVVKNKFLTGGKEGFEGYELKWPNDTRTVQMAPKPVADGMPLAMDLVGGDASTYRIPYYGDFTERLRGKSYTHGKQGSFENKNKIVDPNKATVAPLAKTKKNGVPYKSSLEYNEPVAWLRPDDEFVGKYIKENPDYWNVDFTVEDLGGLGAVLSEAQKKGSPYREFFSGEPVTMTGKEFKKKQASLSGNTILDKKAKGNDLLSQIFNTKSEVVPTPDKGGKMNTKKQKEQFAKAKKTYARRANQNAVGKDFYDEKSKGIYPFRRGIGVMTNTVGNVVPFSNLPPFNVNPIEYEE